MASVDLRALKCDDFKVRQNETFTVRIPQAEIALKLIKVSELGDSGRAGGAFSLWFMSPAGPFLPQSIYPLDHPEMGRLEIFLVPLGPREGGNLYESIFT